MSNVRFLMCRPEHFAVSYAINPWMKPRMWASRHRTLLAAAEREWTNLFRRLQGLGAAIELVPAAADLPDLVFTANAAVVLDRKVLLARFRHPERQGEEPHFARAFEALIGRGLVDDVHTMPDGIALEGAGDCVFDATRKLFWMGYGPRSDSAARHVVADTFGVETIALELADPRFYHMDTALCPLTGGALIMVPDAFTASGLATIRERVPAHLRIELDESDATRLAANAVCINDAVLLSSCSPRLRATLAERGYRVFTSPLKTFLRSGGSAFCLTLRLDRSSAQPASIRREAITAVA